ncbi:quinoprotein dehydrogenase-associated SoxYZ-like carrier [Limibaculum sp. M0105]|uniref:Quinoprotein dehydrogenase-associated SoxYZ-like carrier n=1 Tax=Thermohalobaculum xanthum TaxID=2753746 RepID=A0A8J7M8H7_9RHOB|nr:quinoprotein dehydrogenase-associated SoxYZ-like carrier [Thermohalobaculum xanthum]MBK0399877.1 quinoprotein dehydrogenase-associated SoxYZ-like carrier [Thermohalobaculum xanthum]
MALTIDRTRRTLLALAAMAMLTPVGAAASEVENPMQPSETWEALRHDIVGEREIRDGSALFTLDAPYRAHDAAIVPVDIRALPGTDARVVRLTLVVDENPAPVAAEFEIGPAMGALDLSTRVRVNAYSNIRAIAETEDGALYMVGRYVKASGGCSAPALKDADAAIAALGQMKLRLFDQIAAEAASAAPMSGARHEAQVMVRHPNYSGLQMNQVTRLYIPAHFIDTLEVKQGEELVFRMTAGISISEDPAFRFTYTDNGSGVFHVHATDTEGSVFDRSLPITGGAT